MKLIKNICFAYTVIGCVPVLLTDGIIKLQLLLIQLTCFIVGLVLERIIKKQNN